jgi:PIN domain nuclease of toxin-antitoxin system
MEIHNREQLSANSRQLSAVEIRDRRVSGAAKHAATVAILPPIHNDPFDRLLIAQAMSEPVHFITTDERLKEYSELVVLV